MHFSAWTSDFIYSPFTSSNEEKGKETGGLRAIEERGRDRVTAATATAFGAR